MRKYKKYNIAISVIVVTIIHSCIVSKDKFPGVVDIPEKYRAQKSADSSSISLVPWTYFFSDPDLRALIGDALKHNSEIGISLKNIESAGLALRQARSANIPNVNLGALFSYSRPSYNSINAISLNQSLASSHLEDYNLGISVSWEADIWGKIRNQKLAALSSFLASREAGIAIQTRLVSEVSKSYYELLMLDAQLEIARDNVGLTDSTLQVISLQYRSGKVTSLAMEQAAAQKASAEMLLPLFEQEIAIQENALMILTGRFPGKVSRKERLDGVTFPVNLSAGLPVDILKRRPDIRQAEFELANSEALIGVSRASRYPSLTITAQGGLDAFKAAEWFAVPASLFGTVAGGLTQPLFNQRRLTTNYKLAQIERDRRVLKFRQSVLDGVGEVSAALTRIDKLASRQQIASERTATLQKATYNARLLFQSGLADYLEVITAQGNVLQSQLELATIRKARLDAIVDLYRAVGGGWL